MFQPDLKVSLPVSVFVSHVFVVQAIAKELAEEMKLTDAARAGTQSQSRDDLNSETLVRYGTSGAAWH